MYDNEPRTFTRKIRTGRGTYDTITFEWNGSRTVNVILNGRAVDIWTYGDRPSLDKLKQAIREYPSEDAYVAADNV